MYAIILLILVASWYMTSAVLSWVRLRHFPTPSWVAHFSYLWLAKTTYSGRDYWVQRDLHTKLGPLVRVGPNEIVTDDPNILREISAARSTFTRGDWYLAGRFNPYHDNIFTLTDSVAHKNARTRAAGTYSGREMGSGLGPVIDGQVIRLIELLNDKYAASDKFLDLGLTTCFFTMDVITRLFFGEEFGYLRDEKDHYNFLGELYDLWPQLSVSADVPWIRRILFSKTFLKLFGPKSTDKQGFGALMRAAQEQVNKRFSADGKEEQDMMSSFIRFGMTPQECEVEGLFMLIAGIETTSSVLRSILIHVITSPRVYKKLKDEIHQAVSQKKCSYPIKIEEARRLPYLQAVMYEGIRIRPPFAGYFPKVAPPEGANFHGKNVPSGTNICVNLASLLRSEVLFGADADLFRPERFIDADDERRAEMQRNTDLAFGYGQWSCLGKPLALVEMNKAIFELLRHFDLQLVSPWRPSELRSYGVFLEKDLRVKVTRDTTLGKEKS